jgi:hypothetical protein
VGERERQTMAWRCTGEVGRKGKPGKKRGQSVSIPLSIVEKRKRGDLDLQSGNEADLWPVSQ